MDWSDVPRLDRPSAGAPPRAVRFRDGSGVPGGARFGSGAGAQHAEVRRRGFLAVLATGAMTLGMTVLGWIPLARPAQAKEGTEYLTCGGYSDGPGGPLCIGAPYSADYCGDDNWFRYGCFSNSEGGVDCYEPFSSCYAEGSEARDAWRWEADGNTYRCADGKIFHEGAPNAEFVICSATLTVNPAPETLPDLPALPSLLPLLR